MVGGGLAGRESHSKGTGHVFPSREFSKPSHIEMQQTSFCLTTHAAEINIVLVRSVIIGIRALAMR